MSRTARVVYKWFAKEKNSYELRGTNYKKLPKQHATHVSGACNGSVPLQYAIRLLFFEFQVEIL
jgi:hypothetical protein